MKKIINLKLKVLSKIILSKYKPKIIGITGSVGKTSARNGVYAVLAAKYNVRRSEKNYNNEMGLPLTIIGVQSPEKDFFGWVLVVLKAFWLILFRDKNYPEVLVLEMGVDRPGDMKYLTSIAKPDVGIITLIGVSHFEFFGDEREIQKEKGMLIENLKKGGWAISNFDNILSRELLEKSKAKVLTYGFDSGAQLRAEEVIFSFENKGAREAKSLTGVSFKIRYEGSAVPVNLPNVIGCASIYAALAGAAVGVAEGMNLVDISKALSKFESPKGRMGLINGIKGTSIIDDTYNSAPQSAKLALDIIEKIPVRQGARKFAVLGDMLELGSHTEKGHFEIGKYLVKKGIQELVVVGERSRETARGAEEAGLDKENIFYFDEAESAGVFVQERIKKGDLILVKGSQGMRMEKIVKEIMAEPLLAEKLLVRQDSSWINKNNPN